MSEIRTNLLKSERGDASPSAPFGLRVSGVSTTTTLNVTGNATISGNLGVAGTITYEDVARVDATGISTFREGFKLGPLAGVALTAYKDGSIRTSGIVTAGSYYGDGSNLTGISAGTSLSGSTDNTVCTVTGANAIQGEANFTYDGNLVSILSSSNQADGLYIHNTNNSQGHAHAAVMISGGDNASAFLRLENNSQKFEIIKDANHNLVVEDDGTERLRLDSSGKLLISHGASHTDLHGNLQLATTDGSASLDVARYSANASPPYLRLFKSRHGTTGSNTILQSGDSIGTIEFCGNDGNGFHAAAAITGSMDGTPGNNDMPGRLSFYATANGTTTQRERFRISNQGDIDFPSGNDIGGSASGLVWHNNGSSDSHRLFTTPKTKGGTILGRYQYTHINQGQNYWHDIRSPGGGNYLASFSDQNYYTEIYITVAGTGTSDAYCKYRHYQNSDDNSATLNHIHGNSSTNSNRPYMRLNGQVPQWAMDHSGNYTMSITVDFVGGGRNNGTYTTRYGSYGAN
jgi:hypothetical protein